MTEADIGMTEHRSKNTLGRSAPLKTMTDVEDDGTSEDGSPRPVSILFSILRRLSFSNWRKDKKLFLLPYYIHIILNEL